MKKVFLFTVLMCLASTYVCAQEAAPAVTAGQEMTLSGDIVDNMCASSQKPEELAGFIKAHTKQCALMPSCVESGYSIFVDGKLVKFDKASNAKIEEFLKKEDSKLQVKVTANKVGEELSLISIENQM
jgi:hypothetical protein